MSINLSTVDGCPCGTLLCQPGTVDLPCTYFSGNDMIHAQMQLAGICGQGCGYRKTEERNRKSDVRGQKIERKFNPIKKKAGKEIKTKVK